MMMPDADDGLFTAAATGGKSNKMPHLLVSAPSRTCYVVILFTLFPPGCFFLLRTLVSVRILVLSIPYSQLTIWTFR